MTARTSGLSASTPWVKTLSSSGDAVELAGRRRPREVAREAAPDGGLWVALGGEDEADGVVVVRAVAVKEQPRRRARDDGADDEQPRVVLLVGLDVATEEVVPER